MSISTSFGMNMNSMHVLAYVSICIVITLAAVHVPTQVPALRFSALDMAYW